MILFTICLFLMNAEEFDLRFKSPDWEKIYNHAKKGDLVQLRLSVVNSPLDENFDVLLVEGWEQLNKNLRKYSFCYGNYYEKPI